MNKLGSEETFIPREPGQLTTLNDTAESTYSINSDTVLIRNCHNKREAMNEDSNVVILAAYTVNVRSVVTNVDDQPGWSD